MLDYINILFVHYSSMLMYTYFNPVFYWLVPFFAFINLSIGQTLNYKFDNNRESYMIKEYTNDISLYILILAFIGFKYIIIQNLISYGIVFHTIYKYVAVRYKFRKYKLNTYHITMTMMIINMITMISFNEYHTSILYSSLIAILQILLSTINFRGYYN